MVQTAFLEIIWGTNHDQRGRINLNLYDDVVPKTVKNFTELCNRPQGQGYKKCRIHRALEGCMIQGGDYTRGNGTGAPSIYGRFFDDENFQKKHDKAGLIYMANAGPNTNGSEFCIGLFPASWLNHKNVVPGEVADEQSLAVVDAISRLASPTGPMYATRPVVIDDCGAGQ